MVAKRLDTVMRDINEGRLIVCHGGLGETLTIKRWGEYFEVDSILHNQQDIIAMLRGDLCMECEVV